MKEIKILIVGAGVAGLSLANLLKKQGAGFQIIEKVPLENFNKTGYMLGILPLGGRVITEMDLADEYNSQSIEMANYEIHKENGELIKAFNLDFINENYGSYRGIGRSELIDILIKNIGIENIRFDTKIKNIKKNENGLSINFSNNKKQTYDLLVIADGIHSETRGMLWNNDEFEYYDTQWGGWVAWVSNHYSETYKEYWGNGSFLGIYPIKDQMGLFLGGPDELIKKQGLENFAGKIKDEILPEYNELHQALDTLAVMENPFYWKLQDVRTFEWQKGNVILLGDAACGFLPTAGVGASMALDSAAALADELSRTDKEHLEYGLKLYSKRQQQRVEKAQKDSRELGKLIFMENKIISRVRDYAIRFYSLKQLVKNISKTIEGK